MLLPASLRASHHPTIDNHFTWLQDLQKLARETSSVVDGKLQEQLTAAQAAVFAEQRRRADAEGEAQVREAGAAQRMQWHSLQAAVCSHARMLLSASLALCLHTSLASQALLVALLLNISSSPLLLLSACAWEQVQRVKAEQVQRENERLQRSLAARDSLVQQLKAARMTDTPSREVGG